jgi:hypothetical protein
MPGKGEERGKTMNAPQATETRNSANSTKTLSRPISDTANRTVRMSLAQDLFGNPVTVPLCMFDHFTLSGRQLYFCSDTCRAEWHRLWEDAHVEQRRRDRVPTALDFAEQNPDVVSKIAEWIKADAHDGIISSFRFYWESYRRYRHQIHRPILLNNNHEKTIKTLVLNRYPDIQKIIRLRRVK